VHLLRQEVEREDALFSDEDQGVPIQTVGKPEVESHANIVELLQIFDNNSRQKEKPIRL
jgi:hypothetical protein